MRSLVLTLIALACITQLRAQEEPSGYTFYVGPYAAAKGTIKTAVADGTKTGPAFNVPPDLGVQILAPIPGASGLRFGVDLGLATYSYESKPESNANDSNTIREVYQFINVFPHINLFGLVMGVNIGLPTSASAKNLRGDVTSVYGKNITTGGMNFTVPDDPKDPGYDPSQYLATMVELRVGGNITLMSNASSRLCVNIMAGYTLNGMFANGRNYLLAYQGGSFGGNFDETLNPRVVSFSLGLSYGFGITL